MGHFKSSTATDLSFPMLFVGQKYEHVIFQKLHPLNKVVNEADQGIQYKSDVVVEF